ncbi:Retrotransposable element Tf2 155 kDa protein type 2, partial [Glycine soja]
FTVIMVVVDRYSKGVHLGALPTGFSAFKVAMLFVEIVCKHHGFPKMVNRVLEQYLRCFVNSQPSSWFRYLALAEWCYNTSLHSSSGLTPFEVIYGKPPPTIPQYIPGFTNNEAVASLVQSRQDIHTKLQKQLKKAQASMKKYADAHRDDVTFNEGQWVYVKLRPTRQRSATGPHHPKLSKRYFGPF